VSRINFLVSRGARDISRIAVSILPQADYPERREQRPLTGRGGRMIENTIAAWHECLQAKDAGKLHALLHPEAVFHSPVVHTPQRGRDLTQMYLMAAFKVLNGDDFPYGREMGGDQDAGLECTTTLDGIQINGVELIRWDETGRITDFKVMIRPLKAINMVHQKMAAMLMKQS